MSLPLEPIKAALLQWLGESTTGFKLVLDGQNKPAPGVPYIGINTSMSSRRIGLDDEQIPDLDDEVVLIAAHRRSPASIHAYGPGAYQALVHAYDALELPTLYQTWFEDRDLGAYTNSDVRHIPLPAGSRYEQHAQFDLMITCLNTTPDGDPLTDDPGFADAIQFDAPSLGFTDPTTITAP